MAHGGSAPGCQIWAKGKPLPHQGVIGGQKCFVLFEPFNKRATFRFTFRLHLCPGHKKSRRAASGGP